MALHPCSNARLRFGLEGIGQQSPRLHAALPIDESTIAWTPACFLKSNILESATH